MVTSPRQFDVYLVNLDPTVGAEIQKIRLLRKLGTLSEPTSNQVLNVLVEMFSKD